MPSAEGAQPVVITERDYLLALSRFIRTHESALAEYYAPRQKQNTHTPPSWTTVLTLGIVPTTESSSPPPTPRRREPLVLKFDPHHLYYLLLKFDELGIPNTGEMDVVVEGGTTRPMVVDYTSVPGGAGATSSGARSLLGGMPGANMLGFSSTSNGDDTRSIRSGMSSFSFGSGWWGLGSGGAQTSAKEEEIASVRYIYSSCTKLPALKLSPFHLVAAEGTPALARTVDGFADCPPPATCVPLLAFKNLTALSLEDLDPRGFLGWDVLAVQLRSLEVRRGGIEDIGELICDAPCEDSARRTQEERRNKPVGTERKRRAEGISEAAPAAPPPAPVGNGQNGDGCASSPAPPSPYLTPPRLAWSSLRHLALPDNSLTFVPALPLTFLPSLTSLDLSANLLISVPPALAHLTSLHSLNLSDNMIDSLRGIAKALGAITALNLSRNRLDNLSGLDRLAALERLDLRDNAVSDTLEVSRLARLPHLRELYLRGNPFTRPREEGGDEAWRVKSFGYFVEEDVQGHREADTSLVRLDGALMSGSERRAIEADFERRGVPLSRRGGGRRASAGAADRPAAVNPQGQAKVVVGRRVVTAPHRQHRDRSPPPPLPSSSSVVTPVVGDTASIASTSTDPRPPSAAKAPKARRKVRRIVDLDADPALPSSLGVHPVTATASDSDAPSSSGAEHPGRARNIGGLTEPGTAGDASDAQSSSPARTREVRSLGPATGVAADPSSSPAAGATKRSARRQLSASAFEARTGSDSAGEAGGGGGGGGEALRKRIEALRNEVGDSWLSVMSEREARATEQAAGVPARAGNVAQDTTARGPGRSGGRSEGTNVQDPASRDEERAPELHDAESRQADADPEGSPPSATEPTTTPAPAAEPEASAAVQTTVKSVRKKRAKGGKKKGGR